MAKGNTRRTSSAAKTTAAKSKSSVAKKSSTPSARKVRGIEVVAKSSTQKTHKVRGVEVQGRTAAKAPSGRVAAKKSTPRTAPRKTAAATRDPGSDLGSGTARREVDRTASRLESLWAQRTEFLITNLGSATLLANLLGVSKSQPTRWRTGAESPSPAKARELLGLDAVMARASLIWPTQIALEWLNGSEPYLDGARPIDVLRHRGVADVLDALDAVEQGGMG